ncbi:hypothetical protein F8568_021905 [Actinomadura sp. LD22]|uniref:Uncharacterized protein n=1 Tax=Actinomadura physcomitrii TaxID=2650748 RepID=A0A6I4MB21_9ACTN|nr:hypothetical protein [Actinomadura physcomitrii]MWA02982.1 hypothetical protein [Actinomadura physcomitrii]
MGRSATQPTSRKIEAKATLTDELGPELRFSPDDTHLIATEGATASFSVPELKRRTLPDTTIGAGPDGGLLVQHGTLVQTKYTQGRHPIATNIDVGRLIKSSGEIELRVAENGTTASVETPGRDGLYIVDLQRRKLVGHVPVDTREGPTPQDGAVTQLSPDGTHLAAITGDWASIWRLGAHPVRIEHVRLSRTESFRLYNETTAVGLAWLNGGRKIAFETDGGTLTLVLTRSGDGWQKTLYHGVDATALELTPLVHGGSPAKWKPFEVPLSPKTQIARICSILGGRELRGKELRGLPKNAATDDLCPAS